MEFLQENFVWSPILELRRKKGLAELSRLHYDIGRSKKLKLNKKRMLKQIFRFLIWHFSEMSDYFSETVFRCR